MKISIQNLYYLLLYAWDALEERDLIDVSEETETSIADLFAGVLNEGIHRLLRQGIDRGYISHREEIPGVRGKLDISATVKGDLLHRCRTVCEFDELTPNILQNQILRTTLRRLMRVPGLDPTLCEKLAGTDRRLREIDTMPLSIRSFQSIQLHRNNRFYRFLLNVCRVVHSCMLINEQTGEVRFRDFLRNPHRMRSLFERFLRNFYKRHLQEFDVKRERIRWKISGDDPMALLPEMVTDISLISKTRTRKIVIDAKFYGKTLQTHPHHGKVSLRSGHLYQMFAYLRNLATRGGVNEFAEGILLYPKAERDLDVSYVIHGHPIRIVTLDLNQPWPDIHNRLLGLIQ
jgi:5-methylcytosine-specific restriction enzyme subunit McrC